MATHIFQFRQSGPPAVSGSIRLWFDASDSGSMFTDEAGTTPIDTGLSQNILHWKDKSGNNLHVSNSSNGPQYLHTGFNGKPTVNWDGITGSGTRLRSSSQVFTSGAARTIFIVHDSNAGANNGTFLNFRDTPLTYTVLSSTSSGDYRYVYTDAVNTNRNAIAWFNIPYNDSVLTWRSTGADSFLDVWLNGTALSVNQPVGVSAVTGAAGFTVGNRSDPPWDTGGAGWSGPISEILVYDAALNDTDRANVETYLIGKWGI